MSDLISVIIPAYNAEEYIEKCIDSVISQTYDILEIIIIDDGSVDGTKRIIENAKKRDNRITLFSIENGGPSKARNTGIEHATGEWLLFVDSDDTLCNNACELLLENALKYNADIVGGGYADNIPGGSRKLHRIASDVPIVLSKGESAARDFSRGLRTKSGSIEVYPVNHVPWGKLIKTSLVKDNNVRFPLDLSASEDRIFNSRLFLYSKKHICIPDVIYDYLIRPYSVARSISKVGFLTDVTYIRYISEIFPEIPKTELRRLLIRELICSTKIYKFKDYRILKKNLNEFRNQSAYQEFIISVKKNNKTDVEVKYGRFMAIYEFLLVKKFDFLILPCLKICENLAVVIRR